MAFAQGVQELAVRVVNDVKTWQLDTAAKETADRLLKAHPDYASLSQDELNARVQSDPGYKAVAEQWGTGGTWSMVATAVAGALGGLSASNLGAAAGGAMSPYIANAIKKATTTYNPDGTENTNLLANTMAHAVAGAVLAQMSGNSASAGAAGAAGGELAARAIVAVMYPHTNISDLTESQKQMVSTLSGMAAGLAGGIAADSPAGGVVGVGTGKNAVENNELFNLPSGLNSYGNSASTLGMSMDDAGATAQQINEAMSKNVKGDLPEGANITKVIVNGYKDGVLIAAAAYMGPAASIGKVVGGAVIAEIANGTYQWFDINSAKNQSLPENQQKTWDYWGSASAAVTGGLAPGRGVGANLGISLGSTIFTDGPDKGALTGTTAGWAFGTAVGVIAPLFLVLY
ncbi:VENN motif pre-toxin domain-containing protein [Erwinia sp. P7711]|uniref:VENN motif pre-toxin domain-containing protein n=1 Tax=Erwinia sp. P7711 TaxID=3141451 RepID=UPI003197CAD3